LRFALDILVDFVSILEAILVLQADRKLLIEENEILGRRIKQVIVLPRRWFQSVSFNEPTKA